MHARTGKRFHLTAAATLMLAFQLNTVVADNRLVLKKESDNHVSIDLMSTDAIAGFQFSLNGRGGLTFGACEASERMNAAGLAVYQFLKDDSTLNIVILAPVHAALPAGNGTIGRIAISFGRAPGAETAHVFLTNVVLSSMQAQYLGVTTSDVEWKLGTPAEAAFALASNYPNPFNPSTTITYTIVKPGVVQLAVYDITGRQIETLVDQYQPAGVYSVRWNADSRAGVRLASGMYFARMQLADQVVVRKMTLTK